MVGTLVSSMHQILSHPHYLCWLSSVSDGVAVPVCRDLPRSEGSLSHVQYFIINRSLTRRSSFVHMRLLWFHLHLAASPSSSLCRALHSPFISALSLVQYYYYQANYRAGAMNCAADLHHDKSPRSPPSSLMFTLAADFWSLPEPGITV